MISINSHQILSNNFLNLAEVRVLLNKVNCFLIIMAPVLTLLHEWHNLFPVVKTKCDFGFVVHYFLSYHY